MVGTERKCMSQPTAISSLDKLFFVTKSDMTESAISSGRWTKVQALARKLALANGREYAQPLRLALYHQSGHVYFII